MTKIAFVAMAAACLAAAPAFAQTNGSTNDSSHATPNTAQLRQKITDELTQSGFTNVHVVANSFLVHAVNKQGDPMVMIIDPDSVFSVTEAPAGAHAANAGGGTSQLARTNAK